MIIRKTEEVLRERPEFAEKLEWQPTYTEVRGKSIFTGFQHPKFGVYERVISCKEDGTPLFDTARISEGPMRKDGTWGPYAGAVTVPYFPNGSGYNLGTIHSSRAHPHTPNTEQTPSIEFPRGFMDKEDANAEATARRELKEETGRDILEIAEIGEINPNNARHRTTTPVYAIEVGNTQEDLSEAEKRETHKVDFVADQEFRQMVKQKRINCAWTLASYSLWDTWIR